MQVFEWLIRTFGSLHNDYATTLGANARQQWSDRMIHILL